MLIKINIKDAKYLAKNGKLENAIIKVKNFYRIKDVKLSKTQYDDILMYGILDASYIFPDLKMTDSAKNILLRKFEK